MLKLRYDTMLLICIYMHVAEFIFMYRSIFHMQFITKSLLQNTEGT
jgi:hypothetical protein